MILLVQTTFTDPANTPRFLVHKTGQFFFFKVVPYFNHAKELEFGVLESNETLMPRPRKIGQQAWQNFSASHLPRNDLVTKASTKSPPGQDRSGTDPPGNRSGKLILESSNRRHCAVKGLSLLPPSHTSVLPMHFVSWESRVRNSKECLTGTDLQGA